MADGDYTRYHKVIELLEILFAVTFAIHILRPEAWRRAE